MRPAHITAQVAMLGLLVTPAIAQDTQLTIDQAIDIALKQQPGKIGEAEVDQFEGRIVADIEVINDAGDEIEFKIDLETGEILNVWTDDDPTDDPSAGVLEDMTFLAPGHAGGGWDTMTRAIGQALITTGIVVDLSFENRDGNNGGVGLSYMIENAETLHKTLMLNTTQIVIRSINGTYEDSYAELTPIAAPIGDFAAFIVHPDSEIQSMTDLVNAYQSDASSFAIGGGSALGGMDHLVSALAMDAAGEDPALNYIQFDAPEPAFVALISGEVTSLTTDCAQAAALAEQDLVRMIGVAASDGFELPAGVSSLKDQGIDFEFMTWVGFFGSPSTDPTQIAAYEDAFAHLYETQAWEEVLSQSGGVSIQLDSEAFATLLQAQQAELQDIWEKLAQQ